jgi:hypothetical protein
LIVVQRKNQGTERSVRLLTAIVQTGDGAISGRTVDEQNEKAPFLGLFVRQNGAFRLYAGPTCGCRAS